MRSGFRRACRGFILFMALVVAIKFIWVSFFSLDAAALLAGGEKKDLLRRRTYLVNRVNALLRPADLHSGLAPLYRGEWAVGTYSMTVAALTNLAFLFPETKDDALRVTDLCLEWMMTPDAMEFDTKAWRGEVALTSLEKPHGHIGYLGHLNFMLAAYHALGGHDPRWTDLFHRVSDALDEKLLKSPRYCAETYPGQIFVPDNVVVYASLRLHERLFPGRFHPVINRWLVTAHRSLRDPRTGLLVHTLQSNGQPAEQTRGCGVAWNSFYLPFVHERFAQDQYRRMKQHLSDSVFGLVGLREYPRGVSGLGDIDSGPVLFGLSTSGTGFALAGARRNGDALFVHALLRTAELIGFSWDDSQGRRFLFAPLVGYAIVLAMMTSTEWDCRQFTGGLSWTRP